MGAVLHLRSLGQLTADVQRPYAALANAVQTLGIVPAVTIDGVAFFDGPAVERITAAAAATSPPGPPRSRRVAFVPDDPPQTPTPPRPSPVARRGRGEKPHVQRRPQRQSQEIPS
jgi:hypothetical protein